MKTYHNEADTGGITKIALKIFLEFLDKEDKLAKLQKSDFQCHFSMSKNVQTFLKNFFIEEYQFRTTTFAKIIF